MRKRVLLLSLLIGASGFGVTVVENRHSEFQIVYAENSGHEQMDSYVRLGGELIQSTLKKAAGVDIPLVGETKYMADKPTIFVGNTRFTQDVGLDSRNFAPWEHAIVQQDRHIYVYGKDLPNPLKDCRYPRYFIYFSNGTLKAACTFVEKFVNTRVVLPKHNSYGLHDGVRTLPLRRVVVPDGYAYRHQMRFDHCDGDKGGLLYAVANNYCYTFAARYHVHWPQYAIPTGKYYDQHPEYFALVDGRRVRRPDNPQFCFSNPGVKRLLYEDALRRADQGYQIVELGQSDGFMPCECEGCKALYGTSDWGEKLWRFNTDLAAWLQRQRPGVKVAIACYGPTHMVPKTIKRFPGEGIVIDIAPLTPELLKAWESFNVLGMATWTYYTGDYLHCGYSPGPSMAYLQGQARLLRKTKITSIYNCGLCTVPALGGPWIYAWGKWLEEPDVPAQKLLEDYCRFTFGPEAAPEFIKFYALLDSRLQAVPLPRNEDFNDFNQLYKETAEDFWMKRYPPAVRERLKGLFHAAMKKCTDKHPFFKALKLEFEYLVLTASMCEKLVEFNRNPMSEVRFRLADALDRRNEFISRLKVRDDGRTIEAFNFTTRRSISGGGGMAGRFKSNVEIDTNLLRNNAQATTAVQVRDFADARWKNMPIHTLSSFGKYASDTKVTFQIGYTDKDVLLRMVAPASLVIPSKLQRDDTRIWQHDVKEIFIANGRYTVHLAWNRLAESYYDSSIWGNTAKDYVESKRWNTQWKHQDRVEDNQWISEVTIPFDSLGGRPCHEQWQMQVGFTRINPYELYAWNAPFSKRFADIRGFGDLHFQHLAKPAPVRTVLQIDDWRQGLKEWKTNSKDATLNLVANAPGKALSFKAKAEEYARFYYQPVFALKDDETAVLTCRLRGQGKGSMGVAWVDGNRYWLANQSKDIVLTPEAKTTVFEFNIGDKRLLGARNFYLAFILTRPGGEMIIENLNLTIKKN